MAKRYPSPCIDVCKFRRAGHCTGCSMTKPQKKMWKALRRLKHQAAFIDLLVHQQGDLGGYRHWAPAYLRKCARAKVAPPFGP